MLQAAQVSNSGQHNNTINKQPLYETNSPDWSRKHVVYKQYNKNEKGQFWRDLILGRGRGRSATYYLYPIPGLGRRTMLSSSPCQNTPMASVTHSTVSCCGDAPAPRSCVPDEYLKKEKATEDASSTLHEYL
jgi:hypothetical protein